MRYVAVLKTCGPLVGSAYLPPRELNRGGGSRILDDGAGTGGDGFGVGGSPPGAQFPFGLIKASPDTCDRFGDAPQWAHYGGYHYHDSHMLGFSQTHMAGAIACGCALCRVGAMLLHRCVPRLRPRPCG